jgi:hypothetical protein
MPKELQRLKKNVEMLRRQSDPVVDQLQDALKQYIIMSDTHAVLCDDLVAELNRLGVANAADPRAARDPRVADLVEQVEKFQLLAGDRRKDVDALTPATKALCGKAVELEKDLAAVIKTKSGYFMKSKSLPELKTLAVRLHKIAESLQSGLDAAQA